MTIAEFIREREIRGRVTFTTDDVRKAVNLSDNTILNELQRQVARVRIQIPYRGFYVIIPPQYALKGIVPPTYYIHELMKKVGKPYYVCGILRRSPPTGNGYSSNDPPPTTEAFGDEQLAELELPAGHPVGIAAAEKRRDGRDALFFGRVDCCRPSPVRFSCGRLPKGGYRPC